VDCGWFQISEQSDSQLGANFSWRVQPLGYVILNRLWSDIQEASVAKNWPKKLDSIHVLLMSAFRSKRRYRAGMQKPFCPFAMNARSSARTKRQVFAGKNDWQFAVVSVVKPFA